MAEIERMSDLFAGILDQIDDQIEHAHELGGQMHFVEVRAEQLRDEMAATFNRLRKAGHSDRVWDLAMVQAGSVYENLVALRKIIDAEIELLADAAGIDHPVPAPRFLH
ncbi:hypothetical protein IC232_04670 [Microvirga sp. BT688]|uniref:hypothetical protein n=1 Tax=Microvirga sp. TaxID=1873136 RepID=UPI0016884F9B|nr:hypothetical protein [Microvirga sp.]MBD2745989.1 hypothetical protein [Microvirga sp.]